MFGKDLFNARKTEIEFVKRILKPWVKNVCFCDDSKRDVEIEYQDWSTKTFEIKDNNRAEKNIVFECEYKWKPSGIFQSKADYIVYYFDNTWYYQDRWKLINDLIEINKYKTCWWDNDNSIMWIVEKEIAKILFRKIE